MVFKKKREVRDGRKDKFGYVSHQQNKVNPTKRNNKGQNSAKKTEL